MKLQFKTQQELENFISDITNDVDVNWNNDTEIVDTLFISSNITEEGAKLANEKYNAIVIKSQNMKKKEKDKIIFELSSLMTYLPNRSLKMRLNNIIKKIESAESSRNEETIPMCDCCKQNPATTAKGLCTKCNPHW